MRSVLRPNGERRIPRPGGTGRSEASQQVRLLGLEVGRRDDARVAQLAEALDLVEDLVRGRLHLLGRRERSADGREAHPALVADGLGGLAGLAVLARRDRRVVDGADALTKVRYV